MVLAVTELDGIRRTAFCDQPGIGDGIRNFCKELAHFFFTLEVEFRRRKLHVRFAQLCSGLNTEHDFVSRGILFTVIVNVVGGNQFQIAFFCKFDKLSVDHALFGNTVVHDFEKVVFRTEYFKILVECFFGGRHIVIEQFSRHFSCDTGRECDESFVVLAQEFHIYTRLVVYTVAVGFGNQFAETFVSCIIFAEQNKVVPLGVFLCRIFVETAS